MKFRFIIAFIIAQSLMVFFMNKINISKKNDLLIKKTQEMAHQYKSINSYFDKIAPAVFHGYLNRDEIIKAFENRNRDKLHNLLKDDYNYIKNLNFSQVQFHLPDNTSFLRLHKPEMYGDSLENIRYSVEYVNKYKKAIHGIEIGKVVPGFRYVYPLFDKNQKHIGSVENSFSSMAFIQQLESLYKVHTHFLLSKKVVDTKIVKASKHLFDTAVEHSSFYKLYTENCTAGDKKRLVKKNLFEGRYKDIVQQGINTKEAFSFKFVIKNITKLVTFLPIHNIKKKHIGYFVLYYKDNNLTMIDREVIKRYIIFGFIISLIFIILYKILAQRQILADEVTKQTVKFHSANQELGLKSKELNKLNQSLEDRIKTEVDKNRQKEFELMEASKMVQMGEMIGNIAHQWRQPLSLISTIATSIIVNKEMGILDDKELIKNMSKINDSSQYLSETINIFRDFIKEEKVLKDQVLQDSIVSAISIVGTVLKDVNIKLIEEINYDNLINIYMVSGELPQVIINIINNAKDILCDRDIKDKWVKISLQQIDSTAIITIEDNGGGIPKDILANIFDPYFTTKHQSIGTGLGLHMSKKIIVESLKGKLYAKNTQNGAKFFIELPLS